MRVCRFGPPVEDGRLVGFAHSACGEMILLCLGDTQSMAGSRLSVPPGRELWEMGSQRKAGVSLVGQKTWLECERDWVDEH